jgi:hypothetical protein
MEGISGAASGIAVVSLAIQLIATTRDVRSFFNDIVGAPSEIQRLALELSRLANILRDIQVVIEMQRLRDGAPDPAPSLLTSLETCRNQLSTIHAITSLAERRLKGSGKISKHWESFKTACLLDGVQQFTTEIVRAI